MSFSKRTTMVLSLALAPVSAALAGPPQGSAPQGTDPSTHTAGSTGAGTLGATGTTTGATRSTDLDSAAGMEEGTGGSGSEGAGAANSAHAGGQATGIHTATADAGMKAAQSASGSPGMTAELASASDAEVLAYIHAVNQAEIDAGKAAKGSAQSKQVKALAEKLVKDHTQADKQVTDFAKKEQVTLASSEMLPTGLRTELEQSRTELDRLKTLKGAEFDQAFVTAQAANHDKVAQKLIAVQDAKKDSKLGSLVAKLLPAMKAHGEKAAELQGAANSHHDR